MEDWGRSLDTNLFMDLMTAVRDFTLIVMCVSLFSYYNTMITGRQFDKDGNMRMWWSEKAVQVFNERAKCFMDQYSKYDISGTPVSVTYNLKSY